MDWEENTIFDKIKMELDKVVLKLNCEIEKGKKVVGKAILKSEKKAVKRMILELRQAVVKMNKMMLQLKQVAATGSKANQGVRRMVVKFGKAAQEVKQAAVVVVMMLKNKGVLKERKNFVEVSKVTAKM